MSPALLLHSHRATLVALIAANDAAQVDGAGRFALDGLTDRARRMAATIDRELARPAGIVAGLWGENGKAPLIRSMVRESERLRAIAAVRVEQAA